MSEAGHSHLASPPEAGARFVLAEADLKALFGALEARGYQIMGPTLRDGAIVYENLASVDDLPRGWTDDQDGGTYRLKRRRDAALFGYAVGPHSWKKLLLQPAVRLWRARLNGAGFEILDEPRETARYAFIGVRSCELHAIAIQDRVLLEGPYVDPLYRALRQDAFIVAVNCGRAGGTCFCVSMNTGPRVTFGFDLALTEIIQGRRHYFLVTVGSERGAGILNGVPHTEATAAEQRAEEKVVAGAARQMGRTMDTTGIKELLYSNYDHPRWDEVADRCLTCGNCTNVCPTCFCTTIEDTTDLKGQHAERWQRWDSCFTMGFSYIHGGSIRASARARYRQWMVHKLATWIDQFGTSGCVGCGRCITWCPVGIDITEEVRAIRATDQTADLGRVERGRTA